MVKIASNLYNLKCGDIFYYINIDATRDYYIIEKFYKQLYFEDDRITSVEIKFLFSTNYKINMNIFNKKITNYNSIVFIPPNVKLLNILFG